jgi:hypothetical protein
MVQPMRSPGVRETRSGGRPGAWAAILALLVLSLWLGGAPNACVAMATIHRALGSLQARGWRRRYQGAAAVGA